MRNLGFVLVNSRRWYGFFVLRQVKKETDIDRERQVDRQTDRETEKRGPLLLQII